MNNRRVIDSHCHIYPDRIAARAVAGTNLFYNAQGALDGTVSTLLERGTAAGINRFVVCSVATAAHQVSAINHYIAREVKEHPDRLTGLGTLHPETKDLERDLDEIISLGLHGVKLHPDIQGFKIDDYRCLKIYELCEGRLPILMHTGDRRYDRSNPNRLIPILETYTGLTVIGAHFGGYSVWEEASKLLSGRENFYVDCSSSLPFLPIERARAILRSYGSERVLFGTDYPMWFPERELASFDALELTSEEQERILHQNAEQLFGIPEE